MCVTRSLRTFPLFPLLKSLLFILIDPMFVIQFLPVCLSKLSQLLFAFPIGAGAHVVKIGTNHTVKKVPIRLHLWTFLLPDHFNKVFPHKLLRHVTMQKVCINNIVSLTKLTVYPSQRICYFTLLLSNKINICSNILFQTSLFV